MERFTIAHAGDWACSFEILTSLTWHGWCTDDGIMATPRSGDTLREIAVRYVGFAMIGCSIVVGEVLARVDELISGGVRVRSS